MTGTRELEGRVAVVTGASRGIGKAIAERLASAGATVMLGARGADAACKLPGTLQETAALIERRGGHAICLTVDVESEPSRSAFIDDALRHSGRIDILVNNAGTAIYKQTDLLSPEEALSQMQQYLLGPWALCHHVIPHMKGRGVGWILNLGSCSVNEPTRPYDQYLKLCGNETLYAALKAAIHRFSQGLACELEASNIAVNAVAPVGGVLTPGLLALGVVREEIMQYLEPVEHIAEAALALVSQAPRSETGRIAYSCAYLDEIQRSTMTLDGLDVMQKR